MSKVLKNEREFPVTVTYEDGNETKTVTVEPGKEVEVPEAAHEAATKQVADAVKPEAKAEDKAVVEDKKLEDKPADKLEADNKDLSENERLKVELSEAKQKLATKEAEAVYEAALQEGKLVPAQKDAFLQLSTAASSATISLSDGTSKPLSDVLADFVKAGPKRVDFGEGGSAGDEAKKTAWDNLSEGEQEANRKMNITPDEFNKANPVEATDNASSGKGEGKE